jgi:Tol biopolymer transport system component
MVPSWSRDGKWIYFNSDRSGEWQIWKAPPEGGKAIQVRQNAGSAVFESVDGRYLYFTSQLEGGPLLRMPVAGGPETEVAPKVLPWESISITANGAYFLGFEHAPNVRGRHGQIRTVAKAEKYSFGFQVSVSPDDAYLVFSEFENAGSDLMLVENFR